jgi:peptidoglycan-binding protein ArfA
MPEPGATRFYRRPPGAGWLAALIAVPLVLALIGSGGWNQTEDPLPLAEINTQATPTSTNGARATVLMAPLSLQHSGNDVVFSGQVPDELSRTFALDRARTLLPGSDVIDLLTVIDGITAIDLAGLDPVLTAAAALPDFGFSIEGGDIILTGTATSEAIATGVEDAVQAAWPDLAVVDDIAVITPGAAPQAPTSPAPTGECADLQQRISGLLRTAIPFEANGTGLADGSAALINALVRELRACPAVTVSIIGHTDNTGTNAGNIALSTNQAQAVANAFIRQGVAADRITAEGVGSSDPVASNDTEQGREQNRRIEITVSAGG